MKKLLLAAAMLLCFGAVADAGMFSRLLKSHKATITFAQGTTVTVNGKPVQSGATFKSGDKVVVQGGTADVSVDGKAAQPVPAGSAVDISGGGIALQPATVALATANTAAQAAPAKNDDNSGLAAPPPPPPSPSQNASVAPVSGSAP